MKRRIEIEAPDDFIPLDAWDLASEAGINSWPMRILDQAAPLAAIELPHECPHPGTCRLANECMGETEAAQLAVEQRNQEDRNIAEIVRALVSERDELRRQLMAQPQPAVAVPQGVSEATIKLLAKLAQHADDCTWNTPLPTGYGYWHCTCGLDSIVMDGELLATPPEAKVQVGGKCECCGVGDIAISVECHNSSCANYAIPKTIYAGWNKPQPTTATEQHDKDSEVRG